ncbi:MAG: DUF1206 domain-containing protein, partial [Micromonosporaceae bacterium]
MTNEVEATARRASRHPVVRLLGRVGLVANGLVHLLIAYLALRVATGAAGGEQETGKTGALHTLAQQPGGSLLLWIAAIGLAALTIWQLAEVVWGHRRVRSTRRRAAKRVASGGEAIVFTVLATSAGKLAAGSSGSTAKAQHTLSEQIFALPYGQLLIGAVGVAVLVVAGVVLHRGLRRKFAEDLDLSACSPTARQIAIRLGQIGYSALAVAYAVIGVLIIMVAARHNPDRTIGLDAALQTLATQPYGGLILGVVAAGLAAFGGYCLFDARYRR